MKNPLLDQTCNNQRGFALIATISVMVLLVMIALTMLSLSSIELRSSQNGKAMAEAQANARMALMLALGELQKEMGPDMRVSAEAALFDIDKETPAIEGVDQPHWLASYNAWGNWLNTSYTLPDGGTTLNIKDTYTSQREKMFRRWLVSLPDNMKNDAGAPLSLTTLNDDNSVIMVGPGTLGDLASSHPINVTRAYLTKVRETGKQAWWIGPENHKAKIDLAKQPRTLSSAEWETSQGDTAEVGVGALEGFEPMDSGSTRSDQLISRRTLRLAQIEKDDVQKHFFDLTAFSQGVIASVRTGHLKKDLSLLFENDNADLPNPYRFQSTAIQEPSIRPMSSDLQAKNPTIPNRHFASWTNMRHYYRMYRSSDAARGGTGGNGSLNWDGAKPWTDMISTTSIGERNPTWDGANNYWRTPVLAKITFIYSLQTEPDVSQPGKYKCFLVYSPIFTYWNPYNTEMRIPDNMFGALTSAYKILPYEGEFFLGNNLRWDRNISGSQVLSYLRSGNGSDIIFQPGEIRIFSYSSLYDGADENLNPGFDPQSIGGQRTSMGAYTPGEQPGLAIEFAHSHGGGNVNWGSTPGSLCHSPFWRSGVKMPMMYQNDWLQVNQTHTRITPDPVISTSVATKPQNISRWVFSDSEPNPVAYAQLVIKGLSEFDYESIDWAKDWRSRNWIQAPPFYFGNSLYISEDDTIAHTQRLDNPYVMNFGPMSSAEMPKVVPHLGNRSLLGSGSSPREKITSLATLEIPSAPIASLAGLSNMRINPGWTKHNQLGSHLHVEEQRPFGPRSSLYSAEVKALAYQSGVTGPGIGNSFMHPMLPRDDIHQYFDNSKSQDPTDRNNWQSTDTVDNKVFNDYWDHVFLLNDSIWDDYYFSSLANQQRPGASSAHSLSANLDRLVDSEPLSNIRYIYTPNGQSSAQTKTELQADDGYLKSAKHLMINGMFNVNSTSAQAWTALFHGIRERQLVYRDSSGNLKNIDVPTDKSIALSRFNTEISDQEMDNPEDGATLADGSQAWTGVRYLSDDQLIKLAEECVKQVKLRGPFLNFSEFINRRLSNDDLGTMGALQSAIDYDDDNPDPQSINYRFKSSAEYMISKNDLGTHSFKTPEAAEGSRFAGIPGYVIQSDLLKPISNTLTVRDDTFRIRAYGETNDSAGNVIARAWCEAIVQRIPEYSDPNNEADVPAREINSDGQFSDNPNLSLINRQFGRKFKIKSFRWLGANEV